MFSTARRSNWSLTKAYIKSRFVTLNDEPIIVLGNQKSGTSAVAHLLADYGDLSKTIDIPVLWGYQGLKIMKGEIDFDDIVRRYRIYFSTDLFKEPAMTFFADKAIQRFPKGKYLVIVRDPRSNIRSWLNRHDIPGTLASLDEEIISNIEPQSYTAAFEREVWGGRDENYVGVLAHRWNRAADVYLNDKKHIKISKYESFIDNKLAHIEQLARELGVEQVNDISKQVDVQYQPRGQRDISWNEFFGRDNLATIERICGNRMRALGYMPSISA